MEENTPDVYVTGDRLYGTNVSIYYVYVDGKVYDEMTSTTLLTHSQMVDIAAGYREALTVAPS